MQRRNKEKAKTKAICKSDKRETKGTGKGKGKGKSKSICRSRRSKGRTKAKFQAFFFLIQGLIKTTFEFFSLTDVSLAFPALDEIILTTSIVSPTYIF